MNGEFNETEAYNKPDSEEVAYYKNAVEKERKELISFREKLKEARDEVGKLEEVIRVLTAIIDEYITMSVVKDKNAYPYYLGEYKQIQDIVEKAKSLTTKDK